ncbi:MAG: hypothetical protein OXG15_02480 [Gammaproteobacteria bacterium]|nr:hypothetical protein [Gammaproteobacteria bacterium]
MRKLNRRITFSETNWDNPEWPVVTVRVDGLWLVEITKCVIQFDDDPVETVNKWHISREGGYNRDIQLLYDMRLDRRLDKAKVACRRFLKEFFNSIDEMDMFEENN